MPGNVLKYASWPTALALVLLVLTVILGIVIWSIRRHRDPKLEINCGTPIGELMPSIAGLTQGTVHDGNSVELLVDNAFFEAMFRAVGHAGEIKTGRSAAPRCAREMKVSHRLHDRPRPQRPLWSRA